MSESSETVTVVVTHAIKPGSEPAFEEWLRGIAKAAARHGGYRGYIAFPAADESRDRHVAFRFDSLSHLNSFWSSPDYEHWRDKLADLVLGPSRYRQEIGIEHCFTTPGESRTPSRHKMTAVVFLAILPLSLFIPPRLDPWLAGHLPAWTTGVITTAVIVLLMSYVAMPLITRLCSPWLHPSGE